MENRADEGKDFLNRYENFMRVLDDKGKYDFWFFKEAVYLLNLSEEFCSKSERLKLIEKLGEINFMSAILRLGKAAGEEGGQEEYELLETLSEKSPLAERILKAMEEKNEPIDEISPVYKKNERRNAFTKHICALAFLLALSAIAICGYLYFDFFLKKGKPFEKRNFSSYGAGDLPAASSAYPKDGLIDYQYINPLNAVFKKKDFIGQDRRAMSIFLIDPMLRK